MISRAWFLTPHQRSFGEIAPICTRSLPWRVWAVTRRFDSSYCAWVILPLRRRNWPRECSGELELAKMISPSFQWMVRSRWALDDELPAAADHGEEAQDVG